MSKVCLCMIVKDESRVIKRCLSSVLPMIDSWLIIDTGSTDGTQNIIREFLKDLPGTLLESPWKNFQHNRNEAIESAKKLYPECDYLYFIDADEELIVESNFKARLGLNAYSVTYHYGDLVYPRLSLVSTKQPWRYQWVLHEHLHVDEPYTSDVLDNCYVFVRSDGARSRDPQKFQKDVLVLQEALREDPENTRYLFYLAQSHRDAGNIPEAIEAYKVRASKGGWTEEVWQSLYQCAILMERSQQYEDSAVIEAYLKAYNISPDRAEIPGRLARLFRRRREFNTAITFAKLGITGRYNKNSLFVEKSFYDWICLDEYAISLYWAGYKKQAIHINNQLLASPLMPVSEKPRILENLKFCQA